LPSKSFPVFITAARKSTNSLVASEQEISTGDINSSIDTSSSHFLKSFHGCSSEKTVTDSFPAPKVASDSLPSKSFPVSITATRNNTNSLVAGEQELSVGDINSFIAMSCSRLLKSFHETNKLNEKKPFY
jgi:hypothetical protein